MWSAMFIDQFYFIFDSIGTLGFATKMETTWVTSSSWCRLTREFHLFVFFSPEQAGYSCMKEFCSGTTTPASPVQCDKKSVGCGGSEEGESTNIMLSMQLIKLSITDLINYYFITLFRSITMYCGTDNILHNISHIQS